MNIYQFEPSEKKASKDDWFRNALRTDLNTLIKSTKNQNELTTIQNELIDRLIKKVDSLRFERKEQ